MTRSTYSSASGLCCSACSATYEIAPLFSGCPSCGEQLEVVYEFGALGKRNWVDDSAPGIYRYHRLLPVESEQSAASLHEGTTPMLPLEEDSGARHQTFVKYEGRNPTGSYKDRLNAVVAGMSRQFSASGLACASTGNHGVSMAAYGALVRKRTLVLCDPSVSSMTLNELRYFEAEPYQLDEGVDGVRILAELSDRFGYLPSIRNFPRPPARSVANPYGIEGYKTIAYEIVESLGGRAPDAVFSPVGGGDGIYGVWRGFKDLRTLNVIDTLPRMIACQSEAAASVVRAFSEGSSDVRPVRPGRSIARSIVDGRAGNHALRALYESNGMAVSVSEQEIVAALERGSQSGFSMDPASATSVAAHDKLLRAKDAPEAATAVCVVTGQAYRWPDAYTHLGNGATRAVWASEDEVVSAVAAKEPERTI